MALPAEISSSSPPGFTWTRADYKRLLRQSSFGPAALWLQATARADLELFYAFCRAMDDCADNYRPAQARRYILIWKQTLNRPGGPGLVRQLKEMAARRGWGLRHCRMLIQGVLSDLRPRVRFRTRRGLAAYCHRVAGSVGQACLSLFGLPHGCGSAYAEALGRAFQLVNILRDAAEDVSRGRLYFSLQDLRRHGLSQAAALRCQGMEPVLRDYAEWARREFDRADQLALALPKRPLRPSRLMRRLYGALLERMCADGLRVFEKRYHLPWWHKAWIVATSWRA